MKPGYLYEERHVPGPQFPVLMPPSAHGYKHNKSTHTLGVAPKCALLLD